MCSRSPPPPGPEPLQSCPSRGLPPLLALTTFFLGLPRGLLPLFRFCSSLSCSLEKTRIKDNVYREEKNIWGSWGSQVGTGEHPCLHQQHPCSFQHSVMDHVILPILNLCLFQFLVRFAVFLAQGHQAKGRICPSSAKPCFGYAPAVLSFPAECRKNKRIPWKFSESPPLLDSFNLSCTFWCGHGGPGWSWGTGMFQVTVLIFWFCLNGWC